MQLWNQEEKHLITSSSPRSSFPRVIWEPFGSSLSVPFFLFYMCAGDAVYTQVANNNSTDHHLSENRHVGRQRIRTYIVIRARELVRILRDPVFHIESDSLDRPIFFGAIASQLCSRCKLVTARLPTLWRLNASSSKTKNITSNIIIFFFFLYMGIIIFSTSTNHDVYIYIYWSIT
jgi:hypothetical protein